MIDDDTLILFSYGDELDAAEQARIATAIDADPALAARWARLRDDLDALRLVDGVAAAPLRVARWRRALDAAAEAEAEAEAAAPASGRRQRWLWPAAMAAALMAGIGVGIHLSRSPGSTSVTPAQVVRGKPPSATSSVVPAAQTTARAMGAYLQQSRADLRRLASDDAVGNVSQRAALAHEILVRTRLYERAAVAQGAPELARVLRAFEQSLTALVDEQTGPREARASAEQLSFEFTAMLTRLGRTASDRVTTL